MSWGRVTWQVKTYPDGVTLKAPAATYRGVNDPVTRSVAQGAPWGSVAPVRPPTRTSRGLWRLAPVAVMAAALAACELPGFGAPDAKSEQGESIRSLYQGFFVASIVIALIVYGLIAFSLIRYRRRNDDVPDQRAYIIPLEIFYTATPVVIVAFLFGFSWATENDVTDLADDPGTRVEVIGFQWSWQFDYVDEGSPYLIKAQAPLRFTIVALVANAAPRQLHCRRCRQLRRGPCGGGRPERILGGAARALARKPYVELVPALAPLVIDQDVPRLGRELLREHPFTRVQDQHIETHLSAAPFPPEMDAPLR